MFVNCYHQAGLPLDFLFKSLSPDIVVWLVANISVTLHVDMTMTNEIFII